MKQLILLLLLIPVPLVFADYDSLKIEVTVIEGTKLINIDGVVTSIQNDVTFIIRSPSQNIISIGQVTPNADGSLSTQFVVGENWSQDGDYTIVATQINSLGNIIIDTTVVKVIDGLIVPEFGMITIMILTVAITSIVMLTRLKLVKY